MNDFKILSKSQLLKLVIFDNNWLSICFNIQEGEVTDDDLQILGKAIASKWDRLARQLPKITECDIEEIEDSRKTLSQRGFHMLRLWKTNNGVAADYKTLHDALVHNMVQRKDLAEKHCVK